MVMFAGLDKILTPTKGMAPISFGGVENPNDSLNPGAGNIASLGSMRQLSQTPTNALPASMQGAPQSSWVPNSALSVTNLAPVNVQAATMSGGPMMGSLYAGAPSGGSMMPSGGGGGSPAHIPVTNLAPVHVQAQMPVQPTLMDRIYQIQNDHPFVSSLIKNGLSAAIPILGPVMVAANAYENSQHSQPIFGDLSKLGDQFTSALSGLGGLSFPGGPLGSNAQNPLYGNLLQNGVVGAQPGPGGAGMSGGAGSGGPSILSSGGAIPYHPNTLPAGPAPVGGLWNQQALRAAAPTYGPYAGFGQSSAPFAPSGVSY